MAHTPEPWFIGGVLTGPTTPNISGVTCGESLDMDAAEERGEDILNSHVAIRVDKTTLAIVVWDSEAIPREVALANADLIAAAPDLLAACENILSLLDEGWLVRNTSRDHEPGFTLAQIEPVRKLGTLTAAISKAKGTP